MKIDYSNKKVLLIGGGGTIGTYIAKELLELGSSVDIICLEDYKSNNEKLRYIKTKVTADYLRGFLEDKHYDAIANLLHYDEPEDYIQVHTIIAPKTDHEIFFSSIRALGDAQHPITETAPTILDLYERGEFTDETFVQRDRYSMSKARCERYLRQVSSYKNWTIIRPMINTSDKRLDIVQYTFDEPIQYAKDGKVMYIADHVKDKIAGLEWAGNTGKMIAHLMFKEHCMGKTYMLTTGHRMTWGDVANIYTELLGLKVEWLPRDEYWERFGDYKFPLEYDRAYNREADPTLLLKDSGLTLNNFTAFKDGVKIELKKLGAI